MKILTVCLGNICRSPIAEEILRFKLSKDYQIDSAGLISVHQGNKPDKRAIAVCQEKGLDISHQKSRPITENDLEEFDIIYCMDESVFTNVKNMSNDPIILSKVRLFLEEAFGKRKENDVADPYWGDTQQFRDVYRVLDHAADIIVENLKNSK